MEADGCPGSPPGPDRPCPTAPKGPPHLWGRVHGVGFPSPTAASWLLGWHFLEEVRDLLHQEIAVFQVGEQEGHFALGANGQRAGQDTGAVSFFDNGHLRRQVKCWVSVSGWEADRLCARGSTVASRRSLLARGTAWAPLRPCANLLHAVVGL